jgi:hypothetical protein
MQRLQQSKSQELRSLKTISFLDSEPTQLESGCFESSGKSVQTFLATFVPSDTHRYHGGQTTHTSFQVLTRSSFALRKKMSAGGKRQWKRQNTITLNIYESQNNINHLLSELESNHLQNANREMAYVQANITDLMGKFQDSQTDLRGDLMDVLESFQKGTMSTEELGALLQGEKERGSLSIKLVEEIQSNLEDVIAFVAHFVHDVEQGKPLPKQSFKSLFQELDIVSDSVNSISKVVRTPNRKVREIKAKIGSEVEVRMEKSRGIGGTPAIASFVQQKKEEGRYDNRVPRRDDGSLRSTEQQQQQSGDKITSNKVQMPLLTDRANTPNRIRRGISFRSLSRSPSREISDGTEDESALGLQGKKSNLASHKSATAAIRQKSNKISSKSSVRSATREGDSDDDLSFDSSTDAAIKEIVFQSKRSLKCHRQTQTDEVIPDLTVPSSAPSQQQSAQLSKKGSIDNSRPRLSTLSTNQLREGTPPERVQSPQLHLQGRSPKPLEKRGTTYFPPQSAVTRNPPPVMASTPEDPYLLPSKKLLSEAIEEINFGSTSDYETANQSAKQLEEEVKGSGAIEKYLLLKDHRLTQLEMSLQKKETNLALVIEQQVKCKVEEVQMEASEKRKSHLSDGGGPGAEDKEGSGSGKGVPTSDKSSSTKKPPASSSGGEKTSEQQPPKKAPSGTHSKSMSKQSTKSSIKVEESFNSSAPSAISTTAPSVASLPAVTAPNSTISQDPPTVPAAAAAPPAAVEGQSTVAAPAAKSKRRSSEKKNPASLRKEDFQKIIKSILSFLPKETLLAGDQEREAQGQGKGGPVMSMRQHQPPLPQRKRQITMTQKKEFDGIPLEIQFPTSAPQESGTIGIDGIRSRRSSAGALPQQHPPEEERRGRLSQIQPTSLTQNLRHEEPSPEQFSSLKMIGMTAMPSDGVSHGSLETSHANRGRATHDGSRGGSRGGGGGGMSDDESTFAFDRTDRALLGTSEDRTRTIASEINDIWVPPPSSLVKKRLPSTIVIFPLNTVDSSTSTDDLLALSSGGTVAVTAAAPTSPAPPSLTNQTRASAALSSLDRIQADLTSSSSPLTLLYQHFFPYLSVLSRHHLMAAAAGELSDMSKEIDSTAPPKKNSPAMYSTRSFSALFEMVHEEMSKLEYTSYHALETVPYCEELVGDLIILAQAKHPVNDEFLGSLKEVTRYPPPPPSLLTCLLSRLMGELEIAEAWVDMLLTNSRTVFNRIRALSIHPSIIGENYQRAYSAFLSCQGTNVPSP